MKDKSSNSKVYLTVDNDVKVYRSIKNHAFIRSVTISHESSPAIQSYLQSVKLHYFLLEYKLSFFLAGEVGQSLRRRELAAISLPKSRPSDTFCIHNGCLIMRLSKQTFQRAGLEGHKSKTPAETWDVVVNITRDAVPGSKSLQRLELSLANVLNQPITMLITVSDTVPEELMAHAQVCSRNELSEQRMTPSFNVLEKSLHLDRNTFDWEVLSEAQEELQTYLAVMTLPRSVPIQPDAYISTFSYDGGSETEITTTSIAGLISSSEVLKIVHSLMACESPWFSIQIHGFEGSPITWTGGDHRQSIASEHHTTLVSWRITTTDNKDTKKLAMWEIVGGNQIS